MTYTVLVDGMLSGTGIRDRVAGGYLKPVDLGLSPALVSDISNWLVAYEDLHYQGFSDADAIERLDREGLEISARLQLELPDRRIGYFSNARMMMLP